MNNESKYEIDYTKERLDTPGRLSITVKGRSYYYYPARKRWRARGSNKEYNSHSIDHLVKFLSKYT
jgi:hypothetical protein